MKEFLTALVKFAALRVADPFLFVGDLNTGIGPADGPMNHFGDVDRLIELQETGFTDACRHVHGELIEHTWCRNGEVIPHRPFAGLGESVATNSRLPLLAWRAGKRRFRSFGVAG
jgi:hypothetical protein